MANSDTISLKLDTLCEQVGQLRQEVATLRALMPLSVDGLRGLAELQVVLAKTAANYANPHAGALRELADHLADQVSRDVDERLRNVIEDKVEPLVLQILQAFVPATT